MSVYRAFPVCLALACGTSPATGATASGSSAPEAPTPETVVAKPAPAEKAPESADQASVSWDGCGGEVMKVADATIVGSSLEAWHVIAKAYGAADYPPKTEAAAASMLCYGVLPLDELEEEEAGEACGDGPAGLWAFESPGSIRHAGVVAPLAEGRIAVFPKLRMAQSEYQCMPETSAAVVKHKGQSIVHLSVVEPKIEAIDMESGEPCDDPESAGCEAGCADGDRIDIAVSVAADGQATAHTWRAKPSADGAAADPVAACLSGS